MKNFNYKKYYGQNFLKDNNIINKIVNSIEDNSNNLIIEIGPGSGAITKHLSNFKSNVVCFEIDKELTSELSKYESNHLKIIYENFLNVDLSKILENYNYDKLIIVGNIPYYITGLIVNKIIDETNASQIILMVQKEVGERFYSSPNSRKYNSLSVFLQYNYHIEKICDVSKNSFYPVPKVDSVVIRFNSHEKLFVKDERFFYKLVKDSFRQKRKNLRNNLKSYDLEKLELILKEINKDLTSRAESLTVSDFVYISNNLN